MSFELAYQKLGTRASKKESRYFEKGSSFSALIQIRSFCNFSPKSTVNPQKLSQFINISILINFLITIIVQYK